MTKKQENVDQGDFGTIRLSNRRPFAPTPSASLQFDSPVAQGIVVVLSERETIEATEVAKQRFSESRSSGLKDLAGVHDEAIDILGAMGELVVAKALGVLWSKSVNTFKAPDVCGFQVRTAPQSHQGLIVRPDDCDDDIFILVTRDYGPRFIVRGWQFGRTVKREGQTRTYGHAERPEAYDYSQELLNPMEELPKPPDGVQE